MQLNDLLKIIFFNVIRKLMSFEDKDKHIQKKIDWIASQIRETKFELHPATQRTRGRSKGARRITKAKRENKKKVSILLKSGSILRWYFLPREIFSAVLTCTAFPILHQLHQSMF